MILLIIQTTPEVEYASARSVHTTLVSFPTRERYAHGLLKLKPETALRVLEIHARFATARIADAEYARLLESLYAWSDDRILCCINTSEVEDITDTYLVDDRHGGHITAANSQPGCLPPITCYPLHTLRLRLTNENGIAFFSFRGMAGTAPHSFYVETQLLPVAMLTELARG